MKNYTKIILVLTVLCLSSSLFFSCQSIKEIPQDLTAVQLLQLAMNEQNNENYKAAEAYYMETLKRFGLDNKIYVQARYELANLYTKMKKYDSAYVMFKEILQMYEDVSYGILPAEYQKLAKIGMEKIPESIRSAKE